MVLALAVLVGIALGLLGGGGSILTIPILTYVAGLEAKVAIATSLFVVAVTSSVGAASHARAGRVRWRTGLMFGAGGMAGAHAGGRLAGYLPADLLLSLFAVMMAVSAIAMLRGRRAMVTTLTGDRPGLKLVLQGSAVGVVTGLVGAGGGFVIVPALVILGRLPMKDAVGTSLLVIAMNAVSGLTGYLGHVDIDWPLALSVTAAAVAGSLVGTRLASRVPQESLRLGFGWFVMAMAAFILIKQLA